jgi:16S rRNA (guanine527-N7)-methyltransferase
MSKIVIKSDFKEYIKVFLEENSKLNLISKNDEKFLFEKHIYDSLSIGLFFEKYSLGGSNVLDIGCGGGFPCVPIAIEYKNLNITGADSIRKKINSVQVMKEKLNLTNLELLCQRAESINKNYDLVVSRAVAELAKISDLALPLVKKDGYFVAYKSKKALEELKKAEPILKKYNSKVVDIIEYTLPLDEIYERNLIVIKKN